jgi:hypothetical protein
MGECCPHIKCRLMYAYAKVLSHVVRVDRWSRFANPEGELSEIVEVMVYSYKYLTVKYCCSFICCARGSMTVAHVILA